MKVRFKKPFILVVALGLILTAEADVHSAKVLLQNMAQLTEQAELIFVGKVVGMTDGLAENNLPYTEITFEVKRSIKGRIAARYGRPPWEHPKRGHARKGLHDETREREEDPSYDRSTEHCCRSDKGHQRIHAATFHTPEAAIRRAKSEKSVGSRPSARWTPSQT